MPASLNAVTCGLPLRGWKAPGLPAVSSNRLKHLALRARDDIPGEGDLRFCRSVLW